MRKKWLPVFFLSVCCCIGHEIASAAPVDHAGQLLGAIERKSTIDIEFDQAWEKRNLSAALTAVKQLAELPDGNALYQEHIELARDLMLEHENLSSEQEQFFNQVRQGHLNGAQRVDLQVDSSNPYEGRMLFVAEKNAIVYARVPPTQWVYLKVYDANTGKGICNTRRTNTRALCKWKPSTDQDVKVTIETNEADGAEVTLLTN